MKFRQTEIPGAYTIDVERMSDDRGFFARTFCREEFAAAELHSDFVQHSLSYNQSAGTLRGMHFQAEPHTEIKVVRCTRGAIHDVIVDLRATSSSFGRWIGVDLTEENRRALYIPKGCAHGFISLLPDTQVEYLISTSFVAGSAGGVRWNDPRFGIRWPREPEIISPRDAAYPDFTL